MEKALRASVVLKENGKEPVLKKVGGKANRKEQPLFDINPRTALEYLMRSKGVEYGSDVTFQLEAEQFTQWKEEEERATRVEQGPIGPPTSFSEALLRKLNIQDNNATSQVKGMVRLLFIKGVNNNLPPRSFKTKARGTFGPVKVCLDLPQDPYDSNEICARKP